MKKFIYSLRDDLNGFGSLFLAPSDNFAKRDFASAVNQPASQSALSYAPNDFALMRLGSFDIETGTFELENVPVLVCRGGSVLVEK